MPWRSINSARPSTTMSVDSLFRCTTPAHHGWIVLLALLLGACSAGPPQLGDIADIRPSEESPSATGNPRNYEVFGHTYTVSGTSEGYREQGLASWYGEQFHGRRTSSGTPYDMYAVSAAHKSLPIPTYVRVTNLRNQRSLVVRVNDRGPFVGNRIIDLSYAAAAKLDMVDDGLAPVEVVALKPYQYLPGFPYDNPLGMIANATIPANPGSGLPTPTPEPSTELRFAKQEQPDNERLAANFRLVAYRYPSFSEAPSLLTSADLTATSRPPVPEPQLAAARPAIEPSATGDTPEASFATRGTPQPTGQQLFLQVGAFGERANAEQLRHRLDENLPYNIGVVSDAALHRVKIGPLGPDVDLGLLNHQLAALGLQTIQVVLE